MLKERIYDTPGEARAFLDGLLEVFDEDILPVGLRQTGIHPSEYAAVFVDKGRDDYSDEMSLIFNAEELNRDDTTGERVVQRYRERFPNTEEYKGGDD